MNGNAMIKIRRQDGIIVETEKVRSNGRIHAQVAVENNSKFLVRRTWVVDDVLYCEIVHKNKMQFRIVK
jgi:hypothetical protein